MKKETILNNNIGKKNPCNALVEPIYMTTTYRQDSIEQKGEYLYTGSKNPNFKSLEYKLNSIEDGAVGTTIFPTGMSAIQTILISLLSKGDKVICNYGTYSGTQALFEKIYKKFGVETVFIDLLDIDKLEQEIDDNTKLIFMEAPTNPLLNLYDIQLISKMAKRKQVLVCVDTSILSSVNISPLKLGADIVVQTATKYIGGTADVMGGVVSSNSEKIINKISSFKRFLGMSSSPMNCWLLERGLKTLFIRMKQIEENALYIASELEKQSFVKQVIYPGLKSFPQYELVKKQTNGSAGVISIRLNLTFDQINKAFSKFKLWVPAVSFGGTESLIYYPLGMGGDELSPDIKEKIGYNLVRLSVGIEDKNDLLSDFINAFN